MNTIQEVEAMIENCQHSIKLGESFLRLTSNPDFKAIMEEEFFTNTALNQVYALASPATQTENAQLEIANTLRGIAEVRAFFSRIYSSAESAKEKLREAEETRQELVHAEMQGEEV